MSSWMYLEGKFDGIIEKKTLQNGTELATFKVTEEARGKQEASTFAVTGFKEVAQIAEQIKVGTPLVVKCKLDSRTYQDKNNMERRSTEIKAFALYVGPAMATEKPQAAQGFGSIPF